MRINTSQLKLDAQHTSETSKLVTERLRSWVDNQQSQTSLSLPSRTLNTPAVIANFSSQAQAMANQAPKASASTQGPTKAPTQTEDNDLFNTNPDLAVDADLIQTTFKLERIEVFRYENVEQSKNPQQDGTNVDPDAHNKNAQQQQQQQQQHQGWGLEYETRTVSVESESTTFRASGKLSTQDGRVIQFEAALDMARIYTSESSTTVRVGDAAAQVDPLVVNTAGSPAQLANERFNFDLNSDGSKESIPTLASGSAFLAIDRNSDGQITSGKELFGPASGNGFADLAKEDSDANGWIDEADPAFQKMGLYSPSDNAFVSLKNAGVGALYTGSTSTPFQLKNQSNQSQGEIARSGVFLNEDGSAGTLQHLNFKA